MDEQDIRQDFSRFSELRPPVKRAAYSDRTAWLMAILSEIAYMRFEEEDQKAVLSLAVEMAKLTDQDEIAEKLTSFQKMLGPGVKDNADDHILRAVLRAGGFELKGTLYDQGTDTQGYVAVRRSSDGMSMAVVCFRGTQQIRDWITNFQAEKVPVRSNRPGDRQALGNVHKGFNAAFKSVEHQIDEYLKDARDLPLYITGHSLGGALATLATWYIESDHLAACYTFGAPRVGDDGLQSRFRTPIYRIVNGADPVPYVPPSGMAIGGLKSIVRVVPYLHSWLPDLLARYQGFRHYGYQRYLSICEEGPDGTYPKLRNEIGVGSLERIFRYARRYLKGEVAAHKRIDKYHDISIYRAKLREYAFRRQ